MLLASASLLALLLFLPLLNTAGVAATATKVGNVTSVYDGAAFTSQSRTTFPENLTMLIVK